jgi:predicted Zn-dependent protease
LADALIAAGRGKEADEFFKAFLDKAPGKKLVADAIIQVQEGNTEEAIKILRRVLKASPDNVDAMRYLAAAFLKEKVNLADAEALLRRASQIAPAYIEVLMLLGSALMDRNKFREAAKVFDKVILQQPKNDAARHSPAETRRRKRPTRLRVPLLLTRRCRWCSSARGTS